MTYSYEGNKLQKVVDASNNTDGFKQGSTAAKHYDYDEFGNLKVDRNKGVTGIKYNHLNLPTEIAFSSGKINYLYTATGEKVQKKVTQGSTTVVTDYQDGFQYVDGVLRFFPTAEGYFDAETQNYVYQYRDHLGNVRLSYSDANRNDKIDVGEIIEETNYYPFGLVHSGYNEKNNTIGAHYKYQYNAKELQDELGLNVYDYGARNYDAAIGRWMNVDPLAEDFPEWNPYHYVHNNPMNLIDPTGMSAEGTGGGWFSRAWSAVKNTFSSSAKTEDMTVLDEIVISVKGQTKEERVRDKQIDIVTSRLKEEQLIQEWTNLGVWDPTISYDNYAHAVGSNIGLAMPTARFSGLFAAFSKISPSEKQLLTAANSVNKGGYSAVGRALAKHGNREGTIFPMARGNRASVNAQGENVLLDIIRAPGVRINTTYSSRHGNIIEYIAPSGRGARFSSDGQKFIGFLEEFN